MVDLVEKRISQEDSSDPFPDLQGRIISLLGLDDAKPPKACKHRQGKSGFSPLFKNSLAKVTGEQGWRNGESVSKIVGETTSYTNGRTRSKRLFIAPDVPLTSTAITLLKLMLVPSLFYADLDDTCQSSIKLTPRPA